MDWKKLIGLGSSPDAAPDGPPKLIKQPARAAYFDLLLGEFRALPILTDDVSKAGRAQLEVIAAKPVEDRTTSDLYLFEALLPLVQPREVLIRNLWGIRERFLRVVGKQQYDRYVASKPPDETQSGTSIEALRADAVNLLVLINRANIYAAPRENTRTEVLKDVSLVAVLLFLAVVFSIVLQAEFCGECRFPAIRMAALAGIVGGFISIQRRIQTIPDDQLKQATSGGFSIRLTPLIGAIFAIVLYALFAGNLLAGELFPVLPISIPPLFNRCWTCGSYGLTQSAAVNLGKLVVWSFIAGFAERFVPDTLDRIIAKQSGS